MVMFRLNQVAHEWLNLSLFEVRMACPSRSAGILDDYPDSVANDDRACSMQPSTEELDHFRGIAIN